MTIFLTVLKITGIVLLSILLLLLLTVAIVLFVPVRYRITADLKAEEDHYDIKIKVSWLLHIVRGFAAFLRTGKDEDTGGTDRREAAEGFSYGLKVLWIKLMPGDEPEDHTEESYGSSEAGAFDNERPYMYEPEDKPSEPETETYSAAELPAEPETETDGAAEPEAETDSAVNGHFEEGQAADSTGAESEEDLWKDDIPKRFRAKLKDFMKLLKRIRGRARELKRGAGYKFNSFCDKIQELRSDAGHLRDMIEDDRNREAVKLLFNEIMRILRAMRIRKYSVDLIYGFDDPALTGEITGLLSVLFLSCGRRVSIRPDFDRFRIDGDMYFKGRLMVITLMIVLWKLYFNKDFRKFFREIRR